MNQETEVNIEKQRVLSIASNQGWFEGLNSDEITRLVELSKIRSYQAEELVYVPGEKQDNLYCIIEGLVKVSLVNQQGDTFPLTIWEAGNWFGEGALSQGSVMPVEASAHVDTKVLVLPIAEIDNALKNGITFYKNIVQDMIGRTQLLYRLVDMLLFKTLRARLAARILHLIKLFGEPCSDGVRLPLEFSQSDFAQMSGGSRQRVNRIMGEWYSSGIMTKQEKRYVVHNLQGLEAETT